MAIGDTYYEYISGGSTTASADTLHHFMGVASGGLSDLNTCAILNIQIMASGADLHLFPTNGTSKTGDGLWLKQDIAAYLDLPPIAQTLASQMHFRNDVSGDNAVVRWVVWARR